MKNVPDLTYSDFIVAMLKLAEKHAEDNSYSYAEACLKLASDATVVLITIEQEERMANES
jgi:hypothetical protein